MNAEVAHQNLLEFIVTNNHTFSLGEEPAFKKLMSSIQPLYKPLGASALKARLMKTYVKSRYQVIQRLGNHKVALTTDLWTSPNNLAFMGITLSMLTDKFNPLSIIISFKNFLGDRSGVNIGEIFYEIVKYYKLKERVSRIF